MFFPNAYNVSCETQHIGPSLVFGVTAVPGQMGVKLSILAGGTLFMSPLGGTTAYAAATNAVVRSADPNIFPMRMQFYLCSGATATVSITRYLSQVS